MKITIHLQNASKPIKGDCINAYTKGDMYCVLAEDESGKRTVQKYPLVSIFRVEEEY